MIKNILVLIVLTLAASVGSFSQTPQPTPVIEESLRLCIADVQTQKFETAVTSCTAAIKKLPTKYEGYQGRGLAYFNLKNNDAALADFTKAVSLAPNNLQLLGLRGEFYAITKKNDLALADFNKVLQLDPKNLPALFRRAMINSELGKKDLAIADLKAVLAIDPSLTEAKGALALLEPPIAKVPIYRSEKFKVAFQIPTDSTRSPQSTETVIIFEGKESEFGKKTYMYFAAIEESSQETSAQAKLLSTAEGTETFAGLYRPSEKTLSFKSSLVGKPLVVQLAGFSSFRMSYTEDDLGVPVWEIPNPRTIVTVYIVPVPEHNRVYKFMLRAPLAGFQEWFANAEKSVNSFEILK